MDAEGAEYALRRIGEAAVRALGLLGEPDELTGEGQLRMALPVTWLAKVWACGLELVGGRYLVVAVPEPGWPRTRVLALSAPDSEPADLWVHGTATTAGTPHWHPT
jgi:hypothetical protein